MWALWRPTPVLWVGTYGLSSLSEKTWKSNHLQLSLQRQHFLLSYLKTLSVGPVEVCTCDLPHSSPVLYQLELTGRHLQPVFTWDHLTVSLGKLPVLQAAATNLSLCSRQCLILVLNFYQVLIFQSNFSRHQPSLTAENAFSRWNRDHEKLLNTSGQKMNWIVILDSNAAVKVNFSHNYTDKKASL